MQSPRVIVSEVALALLNAAPGDREALGLLQRRLAALAEALQEEDGPPRDAARNAVQWIERCLAGERDMAEALPVIGKAVQAWQALYRDGQPGDSVPFPDELLRATASTSDAPVVDRALLADFITEATEHLEAADQHLLTLESEPGNLESVNAVFRAFHSIKGVASFFELHDITTLAHQAENLLDKARNNELEMAGEAIEVAFASADGLKRLFAETSKAVENNQGLPHAPWLPALIQRLQAAAEGRAAQPAPAPKPAPEAPPQPAAKCSEEAPCVAPPEQPAVAPVADTTNSPAPVADAPGSPGTAEAGNGVARETVRVDRERLDRLVDTIGELVIAESMVHQEMGGANANSRNLSQLYKITRDLQQLSLSLRMVPIRATVQKMARLARDVARKLGKQVEFFAQGEDTELDKTVVDQIGDPLVHIVRNAIDHGLETPEQRIAAGKTPRGQLTLRAFHRGGDIYLEVEDDGKGLDRKRIVAKALERGLIASEEGLSDREVYGLIFLPGFSTAKEVTDVSGRGVGMDVVKRNIEALRGTVDVRSEAGKGSTITLRLPLTLAIIDGMVVRVGGNRYIMPTASVVELLRPEAGDLSTVGGRLQLLSVRGQQVPLVNVARVFGVRGAVEEPTDGLVMVIDDDSRLTGLLVDEIVGQQQVVIKSLGASLEGLPGLTGGAVLPDGRVGIIIDVHGLLSLARQRGL